jgi:hypothetical protein
MAVLTVLDVLDDIERQAVGLSPAQAAERIRKALEALPGTGHGFTLHRWFALKRQLAASVSERRFLDEVEALLLWGEPGAESSGATRGAPASAAPLHRPTA